MGDQIIKPRPTQPIKYLTDQRCSRQQFTCEFSVVVRIPTLAAGVFDPFKGLPCHNIFHFPRIEFIGLGKGSEIIQQMPREFDIGLPAKLPVTQLNITVDTRQGNLASMSDLVHEALVFQKRAGKCRGISTDTLLRAAVGQSLERCTSNDTGRCRGDKCGKVTLQISRHAHIAKGLERIFWRSAGVAAATDNWLFTRLEVVTTELTFIMYFLNLHRFLKVIRTTSQKKDARHAPSRLQFKSGV
ncbi:hypothetical protein AZH11_07995 [Pseudomonas simiae]|nr:hypothetical protein AZH11_07995 [Pseudomonas simiae]